MATTALPTVLSQGLLPGSRAVSNGLGYSSLYGIVEDGAARGEQFGWGGGCFNGALTLAGLRPAPTGPSDVPEPSTRMAGLRLVFQLRARKCGR